MFGENDEIQLIDFSYARLYDKQDESTATQDKGVFEGNMYYSARIPKSKFLHSVFTKLFLQVHD